jgi:hypothetical protein
MLHKDPAQRFQTATEVSRALVEALPTAARDKVRPLRERLLSLALKSLVGLGAAGCLAGLAFAAGAVGVFWFVLSEPPLIASRGIPDSLARALAARRVLAPGDTVQLAFQPGDRGDSILFLVSQHRVAVLTPHRTRSYPRDSVAYTFSVHWKAGLDVRYVLIVPGARRDTVYPEMSPRGAWSLAQRLEGLLPADSVGNPRVREDTKVPGASPVRIRP